MFNKTIFATVLFAVSGSVFAFGSGNASDSIIGNNASDAAAANDSDSIAASENAVDTGLAQAAGGSERTITVAGALDDSEGEVGDSDAASDARDAASIFDGDKKAK